MTDDQAIVHETIFEKISTKFEEELVSYETALETMQRRAAAIRTGEASELLWFSRASAPLHGGHLGQGDRSDQPGGLTNL